MDYPPGRNKMAVVDSWPLVEARLYQHVDVSHAQSPVKNIVYSANDLFIAVVICIMYYD